MNSMYAKLFSRIAQSSLMEQPVEARYCFMMLLAISDAHGDVIGTDTAIARSINLPLGTFRECISTLMLPDPDSNSKEHDGCRILESETGRGYFIVNYTTYRAIKTDEEKRAYMREYMRKRRNPLNTNDVTGVNKCKSGLGDVTHAESEEESKEEGDSEYKKKKPPSAKKAPVNHPDFEAFWSLYPRKENKLKAQESWNKQKPDIAKVTSALKWQKANWDDPQFIPMPTTYLNQRRFDDEKPQPSFTSGKSTGNFTHHSDGTFSACTNL